MSFKPFWRLIFILCGIALGPKANGQFLPFPVEKNGVKIFPQRFEYQLIDKDRFLVGDILIDASRLDIQLVPVNKNNDEFRLRFRWPAGLVKDGELLIKDNVGKALWTQKIQAHQIQLSEEQGAGDLSLEEAPSTYRTSLAVFETKAFEADVLQKLQYTAFFKLCVAKSDQDTRIYLCSKDLYIKKKDKTLSILSRDSFRKESYVEINGRPVDPQGAIFLNEKSDTISMRTLMMSGATLELSTRRKDVFFKDVVLSENGESILIRAVGTDPVKDQAVKHLGDQDWEAELPAERPIVYLKGEGDIPLRQEFLIQGPVRKDSLQLKVAKGWEETTYSSEVKLQFDKLPPNVRLSSSQRGSSLQSDKVWVLQELESGSSNRRYLNVENGDGKFVAAFDVYRGMPFELSTLVSFPLMSESEFQWWLPGFRFGLALRYEKILSKPVEDPDWANTGLDVRYRFQPGLHMRDPSSGLQISYDSAATGSKFNFLSLGLWTERKTPDWLAPSFEWWLARAKMPLSVSGTSGYSLATSYDVELLLRQSFMKNFFYQTGLQTFAYKLKSDVGDFSFSKSLFILGIGGQF